MGKSLVPHESLSSPIEERLIEEKHCFCDLGPCWGLRGISQLTEDLSAVADLEEEGLDSADCGALVVVERGPEVVRIPVPSLVIDVGPSSLVVGCCVVDRVVEGLDVSPFVGGSTFERGKSSKTPPCAPLPRGRRRPKKVIKGRKPRLVPQATCVDFATSDGGGSPLGAITPSISPAPLNFESAPGGSYWTRAKKAWLVKKLVGCMFPGGDEVAIRGLVQEMKEWWSP